MTRLSIDFETRSTVDLRATGVYPYAAHPDTDVWCMAYAFDDDEIDLWVPGMPCHPEVVKAASLGGVEFRAWNAQFERIIWRDLLTPRYGFPYLRLEAWFDTAAEAAALALPRGLDGAGQAMGLATEKDKEGHALMLRMARPRSKKGVRPLVWWDDDYEKLARLYSYCMTDVYQEREIARRLRVLGPRDRRSYLLDQRINDRGVMVDIPLVLAASDIVEEGKRRCDEEMYEVTGGVVARGTQNAQLTRWLSHRTELTDIRKDTLRDWLEEESGSCLDGNVVRAVEIRTEVAKSSTAKLKRMLQCAGADDRVRGLLLWHAASTGRWAGRLIQPQNFPRPTVDNVEQYIDYVLDGEFELIDIQHPAMAVVASMLRSMLIAADGHRFISGDYSQIEARVLAWIANQNDLVADFASGAKIYEQMASYIYKVPVEEITKDDPRRQVGKNTVLGSGFQMGGATMAEQVRVQTGIVISEEEGERAVKTYRRRYTRIPTFWRDINEAAKNAVKNPGEVFACGRDGKIRYVVRGQFLWCILPSGRALAYAKPQLVRRKVTPRKGDPFMVWSVRFLGVNSKTRKWTRHHAYGGYLTENVVQAMARDLLDGAATRLDSAGYPLVLSVHDELLAEVPYSRGSQEEFLEIMQTLPRWAEGLPIAAEGWEGKRYRK